MASGGMAHPTVEKVNDDAMFVDKLPEEINEMKIKDDKVEKEMEVTVVDGNGTETGHIITISYMAERVVGQVSFGIFHVTVLNCQDLVFQKSWVGAKCLETGEAVAIKKVLQDKRYKNRELQMMLIIPTLFRSNTASFQLQTKANFI
uniref:Uncharacterized protein n=2 Tax=Helianthus annuus TaxID=4232 RepID=A0A251TXD0_HELAN